MHMQVVGIAKRDNTRIFGGYVGTTWQVRQAEMSYIERNTSTRYPQLCNKLACSTSALDFSDRYPTLHLNGLECLLNV